MSARFTIPNQLIHLSVGKALKAILLIAMVSADFAQASQTTTTTTSTSSSSSYSPPPLQYTIPSDYGGYKADCNNTKFNCVDVQICLKPSGRCEQSELVVQRMVFENMNTAVPTSSTTSTTLPLGVCAWVHTSDSPSNLSNCPTVAPLDPPASGCTTANVGSTTGLSSCIAMSCNGVGAASPNPASCSASQTLNRTFTCQCNPVPSTTTTTPTSSTTSTTTSTTTTTTTSTTTTSTTIPAGGGGGIGEDCGANFECQIQSY